MAFSDDEVLSIPMRVLITGVAALPVSALVLCILFSILLHYEETTSTHCHVENWLPSVSAAVATFAPQKYIWRVLIGLQSAPRFLMAFSYRNYLLTSPLQPLGNTFMFRMLCQISCAIHCMENMGLVMLTAISSTDSYASHKIFFCTFALSSMVYMFLSTWLFNYSGRRRASSNNIGERSFEYKSLSAAIAYMSMFVAAYLYYRHNKHCEAGVYTLFALSEYTFIMSNIAFHFTLYLDFYGKCMTVGTSSLIGTAFQYQLLPTHASKST